ncbi:MAG: RidA family protein [Acidiphilium sp.]
MTARERLAELGIELPEPAKAVANYVPLVVAGGFATVSGQLPLVGGKLAATGKLGETVSVEAGIAAARICFINILAQLDAHLVDGLGSVARVVRLGGFIAAAPHFTEHAKVMNGASDLAVAVFGDSGRHARSTVGVASLPLDAAVEVEGIFLLG